MCLSVHIGMQLKQLLCIFPVEIQIIEMPSLNKRKIAMNLSQSKNESLKKKKKKSNLIDFHCGFEGLPNCLLQV